MSAQQRLPLGTQVVVQGAPAEGAGPGPGRGLAGRVVSDTGDEYTVALVDGRLVVARDEQLMSLGDRPMSLPAAARVGPSTELVTERTIYAAAVGNPGLADSETTVRGIYQAPTRTFWSLRKPPKHVAGPSSSWFSWEVERFCQLALEADPTCHELLWSSRPVWVGDAGGELLDLRAAFLSQSISPAYAAYVLAQFKKLDESARDKGEQRWARAEHLARMLLDGIALLRTGDTAGSVSEHREQLAAVRAGQVAWEQVESWRLELQQKLDEAAAATYLPADPDTDRVDAWLSELRRRDLDKTT